MFGGGQEQGNPRQRAQDEVGVTLIGGVGGVLKTKKVLGEHTTRASRASRVPRIARHMLRKQGWSLWS